MSKSGKRMEAVSARVERDRFYSPQEAVALARETATARFDETIEVHLRTGLDGRHADQQVRGSVVLPHGLGRAMRVAVFAEGEAATLALDAGADAVGSDDLARRFEGGELDYDVVLAQREMMPKIGRLGRLLGPRGLMPNPRNNTVLESDDLVRGVREAKSGRVEFRLDRTNLIHCAIGKASFEDGQLVENLSTLIGEIQRNRPSGGKGQMIRGASLASTMGPGIRMDVGQVLALGGES